MSGKGIMSLTVLGVQERTSAKGNKYRTVAVLINGYTANIMASEAADLTKLKMGMENELNIEATTYKGAINLKIV